MVRSLEELAIEKIIAPKEGKSNAVAEVKRIILKHKLTKGDIRGKAWKQLDGWLALNSLGHVDCTRRYKNEFK